NDRERGKGWAYRLPKDAEWEYACRGAASTKEECSFAFYFANPTNDLSSHQANYDGGHPAGQGAKGPCLQRPTKVGSYAPNMLGLYDMHGNVGQWCDDFYFLEGPARRLRGGGWSSEGSWCGAGYRGDGPPSNRTMSVGFRLARVPT